MSVRAPCTDGPSVTGNATLPLMRGLSATADPFPLLESWPNKAGEEMRPFIVIGDMTDHGGVVIGSTMTTDTHGKGLARVGDQVTCPKKGHGTTVIVTGDPTMIVDGAPVARHGDKCACGATLISSQVVSRIGDGGGGGGSTLASGGLGSSAHDVHQMAAMAAQTHEAYDQHFVLTCSLTNMPLAHQPYRLRAGGKLHEGVTDEKGRTVLIATGDAADDVTCEILGDARHG